MEVELAASAVTSSTFRRRRPAKARFSRMGASIKGDRGGDEKDLDDFDSLELLCALKRSEAPFRRSVSALSSDAKSPPCPFPFEADSARQIPPNGTGSVPSDVRMPLHCPAVPETTEAATAATTSISTKPKPFRDTDNANDNDGDGDGDDDDFEDMEEVRRRMRRRKEESATKRRRGLPANDTLRDSSADETTKGDCDSFSHGRDGNWECILPASLDTPPSAAIMPKIRLIFRRTTHQAQTSATDVALVTAPQPQRATTPDSPSPPPSRCHRRRHYQPKNRPVAEIYEEMLETSRLLNALVDKQQQSVFDGAMCGDICGEGNDDTSNAWTDDASEAVVAETDDAQLRRRLRRNVSCPLRFQDDTGNDLTPHRRQRKRPLEQTAGSDDNRPARSKRRLYRGKHDRRRCALGREDPLCWNSDCKAVEGHSPSTESETLAPVSSGSETTGVCAGGQAVDRFAQLPDEWWLEPVPDAARLGMPGPFLFHEPHIWSLCSAANIPWCRFCGDIGVDLVRRCVLGSRTLCSRCGRRLLRKPSLIPLRVSADSPLDVPILAVLRQYKGRRRIMRTVTDKTLQRTGEQALMQLCTFNRIPSDFAAVPPALLDDGCVRAQGYRKPSLLEKRLYARPIVVIPPTCEHKRVFRSDLESLSHAQWLTMAAVRGQLVTLGRSGIHGYGMYARCDLHANELVMEYTGQVVRQTLADKREIEYESTMGHGATYLWSYDDNEQFVIDATNDGCTARLINHSCDPCCVSDRVCVEGRWHIVILTKRAIRAGEEITYDYQLPLEDDKIPCCCGATACRGTMN